MLDRVRETRVFADDGLRRQVLQDLVGVQRDPRDLPPPLQHPPPDHPGHRHAHAHAARAAVQQRHREGGRPPGVDADPPAAGGGAQRRRGHRQRRERRGGGGVGRGHRRGRRRAAVVRDPHAVRGRRGAAVLEAGGVQRVVERVVHQQPRGARGRREAVVPLDLRGGADAVPHTELVDVPAEHLARVPAAEHPVLVLPQDDAQRALLKPLGRRAQLRELRRGPLPQRPVHVERHGGGRVPADVDRDGEVRPREDGPGRDLDGREAQHEQPVRDPEKVVVLRVGDGEGVGKLGRARPGTVHPELDGERPRQAPRVRVGELALARAVVEGERVPGRPRLQGGRGEGPGEQRKGPHEEGRQEGHRGPLHRRLIGTKPCDGNDARAAGLPPPTACPRAWGVPPPPPCAGIAPKVQAKQRFNTHPVHSHNPTMDATPGIPPTGSHCCLTQ